MKRFLCLALLLVTGCVPVRYHGQTYHLVIGLGLFHVEQTNQVTIVHAKSLGVYSGDGRLNIGLSGIYSVSVPTNANVLLDIK